MKLVLGLLLVLAMASVASAAWHVQWVEKTENVQVYIPGAFHRCDQGVFHQVPGMWVSEARPYWTKEWYWTPDPIIQHEIYPVYPQPHTHIFYP